MNPKTTVQLRSQSKPADYSKTDGRYWASRVRKPVSSRLKMCNSFSMECQFRGRRLSFPLHTANKDQAGAKAAKIYINLLALGIDETIKKHRAPAVEKAPDPVLAAQEAAETTLGEWIAAAEKVFTGEPTTFGSYVRSARQIAKWIQESRKPADQEKKLTKRQREEAEKETRKRFSSKSAPAFHRLIDVESITIFTRSAIQEWRKAFVERAGNDEALKKRARISSNSLLRQAKALFSEDILDTIEGVKTPSPLPFDKCKFYAADDMSYRSQIDPSTLLRTAKTDLSESDPEPYKVLLLSLGGGLRRAEVDTLTYHQIDFANRTIHMQVTTEGRRKTQGSENDVPLDEATIAALKGWKQKAKGKFVVEATGIAEAKPWGRKYRCDEVFKRAIKWLRIHGVDTQKPLHTLRKEAGSLVATEADIQAAKQFLRHKSIAVTSAYYAQNKAAHTVKVGDLLKGPPPQTQEHH